MLEPLERGALLATLVLLGTSVQMGLLVLQGMREHQATLALLRRVYTLPHTTTRTGMPLDIQMLRMAGTILAITMELAVMTLNQVTVLVLAMPTLAHTFMSNIVPHVCTSTCPMVGILRGITLQS